MLAQEALGKRHADGDRQALAERPGRRLDAGRLVDAVELGVARRHRVPLAEVLQLLERELVAGEVQRAVEQHRAVPCREHEAVAIGPAGVARVVAHDARVEQIGGGRHRHRHPRVTRVRGLDGVHRQRADGVDRELLAILGFIGHGPEPTCPSVQMSDSTTSRTRMTHGHRRWIAPVGTRPCSPAWASPAGHAQLGPVRPRARDSVESII